MPVSASTNTIAPAKSDATSTLLTSQTMKAAPPATAAEPSNEPSIRRNSGATKRAKISTIGSAVNGSASGSRATGTGSGSPSMRPINASRPAFKPAGVILLVESRRDRLGDDAPRERVGHRAFEAVADLEAHASVVEGDDEHHAVIDLTSADAPLLGDAQRIRLDGLRRSRAHEQHCDLTAFALLERREFLLERREGLGGQSGRGVDDVARQRRNGLLRSGRSRAQHEGENDGLPLPVSRAHEHRVTGRS